VKAKRALSERTYVSMMCPLVLDRDVNSARNLAELGEAMVAGRGPETINRRGGLGVLALPVKRQPGIAQTGKTGAVQPRGRTALSELTNAHCVQRLHVLPSGRRSHALLSRASPLGCATR
jgi:hypothetical protein